ncbi:MAG: fibronectin type III domain-containing protein [Deltaproteobacteria bacterium]|nr:fibronectin type III domain-containing protein [Deltaproteobacteria bacterium]
MRTLLTLLLVTQVGCTLSSIDLAGRPCPCAVDLGYVCDDAANRCVLDDNACEPVVSASSFRARWATSDAILWKWQPAGEPADFIRYEVQIWDTADPENVRTVGPDENAELSGYYLGRTGMPDVVTQTVIHGLEPGTTYGARLIIVDPTLCEFRSDVAAISTIAEPPAEVVIFRDSDPRQMTPPALVAVDDGAGGRVLEYRNEDDRQCDGPDNVDVCSQNLTLRRIETSLSPITPAQFESAFLEIRVSYDGTTPSYYSRIWIGFNSDCDVGPPQYGFTPFTLGSGAVTLQVPLRALVLGDGTALNYEAATADPLCRVNLGGQFARFTSTGERSRIRIGEVRVRY